VQSIRQEKRMDHEASSVPDQIREWLWLAIEAGASDLHLIIGYPPVLRLHGDLTELPEPPLNVDDGEAMLRTLCPPGAQAQLQTQKSVDFSFSLIRNHRRQARRSRWG
jgi:twitching motility protein PilT